MTYLIHIPDGGPLAKMVLGETKMRFWDSLYQEWIKDGSKQRTEEEQERGLAQASRRN